MLAAAGRRSLRARMEEVMGEFPSRPRGPLDVQITKRSQTESYEIRHINYLSEPGDRVPAILLIPQRQNGRAALCLHQTTKVGKAEPAGLAGNPDLRYAAELAERGFVSLSPDYPNFGEYTFDPYAHGYASATMKGLWNHSRAVDVLEATPGVSRRRIGCIGHSLGGHNTLFLAAFDHRIRAMVTSCGFTAFARYYGGDLKGWSHKGYMPRIAERYGARPDRMPFDFPELIASLAPRPLFVNAPLRDANFDVEGVRECIAQANKRYRGDRLQARYPDAAHSFPSEVRSEAYGFLERWL